MLLWVSKNSCVNQRGLFLYEYQVLMWSHIRAVAALEGGSVAVFWALIQSAESGNPGRIEWYAAGMWERHWSWLWPSGSLSLFLHTHKKGYKILWPVTPACSLSNCVLSLDREILVQFVKVRSPFCFLLVESTSSWMYPRPARLKLLQFTLLISRLVVQTSSYALHTVCITLLKLLLECTLQ